MAEYYKTLREANVARSAIWGKGTIDNDFRVNELAGEIGELCNCLKKMERERLGEPGSRVSVEHALDECADGLICIDLLAMNRGFTPTLQIFDLGGQYPDMNLNRLGLILSSVSGGISGMQFEEDVMLERGQGVDVDMRNEEMADMSGLLQSVIYYAAWRLDKDANLNDIVATKFNATSDKVNIPIYMYTQENRPEEVVDEDLATTEQ